MDINNEMHVNHKGKKKWVDVMDILLVDDHSATREEIALMLERHNDFCVVGQADNGMQGLEKANELNPDIVLMDVMMPGMNGIRTTEAVLKSVPQTRVIALSNHTGVNLIKALLQAGATGYVRKDQAYEELIPAIQAVTRGEQYIGKHADD